MESKDKQAAPISMQDEGHSEKEDLDEKNSFLVPFKHYNMLSLGELKPGTSCCAWFGVFCCGTKVQLIQGWRSCEQWEDLNSQPSF